MASQYQEAFINEMIVRGLKENTRASYVRSMKSLCNYHKKSADQLGIPEIKEYQRYLSVEKKLSANSINKDISAIRFFYKIIMNRHGYDEALPRLRAVRRVPQVLSEAEVASMIESVNNVFYKAILSVLYSAGLRQSELRNLKVTDIDSKRMVIHIRDGKGGMDRQALLSPVALGHLRNYWRLYRLKSSVKSKFLFIAQKNSCNKPLGDKLSHTVVGYIVSKAAELAGIKKKFTLTCFGTLLLHISLKVEPI